MLKYRSQHTLIIAAALLLTSALFHIAVWWLAGMPSLDGPVSWRKPITFGLSTGVLFLSLAWILGLLPDHPRRARQARWFTVLLIAEVALIAMQQWRGVASHFNDATRFDAAVFSAMGVLIMIASGIIAIWTWAVLTTPLATTRAQAWGARIGMLMLNVGNLIGGVMAATHTTDIKPLHGLALHVIQALPVALWVATRVRYPRAWRDSRLSHWLSSPGLSHP
jgi:hypothetical protein